MDILIVSLCPFFTYSAFLRRIEFGALYAPQCIFNIDGLMCIDSFKLG